MILSSMRGAWKDLDAKLRPFIMRRVRSPADAEDVLQETLVRLHRGIGTLRDDERFGAWVYKVAARAVADHRRASSHVYISNSESVSRDAGVAKDDGGAEPGVAETERERQDLERQLASHVGTLVALLPSPYREALTLTELQGLTQREAADMLGVSLSGMKSRVQRGRVLLREAFDACCRVDLDVRGGVLACEPRVGGLLPNCRCDAGDARAAE